jgi:hypothetical protein
MAWINIFMPNLKRLTPLKAGGGVNENAESCSTDKCEKTY